MKKLGYILLPCFFLSCATQQIKTLDRDFNALESETFIQKYAEKKYATSRSEKHRMKMVRLALGKSCLRDSSPFCGTIIDGCGLRRGARTKEYRKCASRHSTAKKSRIALAEKLQRILEKQEYLSCRKKPDEKKCLQSFLRRFPDARNRKAVEEEISGIDEQRFSHYQRLDRIEKYEEFIRKYPDSRYREEAAHLLKEKKCEANGMPEAIKGFLSKLFNSMKQKDLVGFIDLWSQREKIHCGPRCGSPKICARAEKLRASILPDHLTLNRFQSATHALDFFSRHYGSLSPDQLDPVNRSDDGKVITFRVEVLKIFSPSRFVANIASGEKGRIVFIDASETPTPLPVREGQDIRIEGIVSGTYSYAPMLKEMYTLSRIRVVRATDPSNGKILFDIR